MDSVVERLERCLTDVAIQDTNARVFWNANFAGKSRVRFDKFETSLNQFLNIDASTVDETEARIRSKCLRAMIGLEIDDKHASKSDMVHIEALGKVGEDFVFVFVLFCFVLFFFLTLSRFCIGSVL